MKNACLVWSVVAVTGLILVVWVLAAMRHRCEKGAVISRKRQGAQDDFALSDQQVLERLSPDLQHAILDVCESYPSTITEQWICDIIMEKITKGNMQMLHQYFMAIIEASCGAFAPAAKVGDVADNRLMQAAGGDKVGRVKKVFHCGLIRTKNGEVIVQAIVA